MLNFISMLYIALYKLLLTLIDIDSLIALNVRINWQWHSWTSNCSSVTDCVMLNLKWCRVDTTARLLVRFLVCLRRFRWVPWQQWRRQWSGSVTRIFMWEWDVILSSMESVTPSCRSGNRHVFPCFFCNWKIHNCVRQVPEKTVGDHMEGQDQKQRHQKENWFKETGRYN